MVPAGSVVLIASKAAGLMAKRIMRDSVLAYADTGSIDYSPSQCARHHTQQERAEHREKEDCAHGRPPGCLSGFILLPPSGLQPAEARHKTREGELCSRVSSHQTALVPSLAHGDVRTGRNLSDRQARSDPAAKSQKDKKSEQFPHNRLRSDGSQPCQGCRIAGALFQADF